MLLLLVEEAEVLVEAEILVEAEVLVTRLLQNNITVSTTKYMLKSYCCSTSIGDTLSNHAIVGSHLSEPDVCLDN